MTPQTCSSLLSLKCNWVRVQVIFKFKIWFRVSEGCPLLLGVGSTGREAWRCSGYPFPSLKILNIEHEGVTAAPQRGPGGVRLL